LDSLRIGGLFARGTNPIKGLEPYLTSRKGEGLKFELITKWPIFNKLWLHDEDYLQGAKDCLESSGNAEDVKVSGGWNTL
jgi:hypothetical protein